MRPNPGPLRLPTPDPPFMLKQKKASASATGASVTIRAASAPRIIEAGIRGTGIIEHPRGLPEAVGLEPDYPPDWGSISGISHKIHDSLDGYGQNDLENPRNAA